LRPSHMAIIAGLGVALVAGGIGIGTAINDDGNGERVNAPFGRDFKHGGPGPRGFRRDGPGEPGGGPNGPGPGYGFRGGQGGQGPGPGGPGFDPGIRQVLMDIQQAIAKDASKTAGPILDKAVKDKKITKAQADAIRSRLSGMAAGGGLGLRGP